MGSLTRTIGNSFTTSGVIKSSAIDNTTLSNVSALPAAIPTGSMVLLSTQTASASASISFTSGIDSTYKEYMFVFNNIHPATDSVYFTFNLSTDGGSNYNVTKTSTFFFAYHTESDSDTGLIYETAQDLAQSTGEEIIVPSLGNDADQNASGSLTLFNPSSTTYVKHYIARVNDMSAADYMNDCYKAGYANTTSAVNAIRFKMSSGNIDDGTIQMFGIK